ncbi:MAG: glycosyltransferase [Bacteroidota bacterium]
MRTKITHKQPNLPSIAIYNPTPAKTNRNNILMVAPLPEILFLTTYPPRECGIATYSLDLIQALNNKFESSFAIKICPLESTSHKHNYTNKHLYTLNTDAIESYLELGEKINANEKIKVVLIQHEFGLFHSNETAFLNLLNNINKPVIVVFHTVLPHPNEEMKSHVQNIASNAKSIVVMTNSSASILVEDYEIPIKKITIIPHGTHLVKHSNKEELKIKYNFQGRKVMATFGLLSSGKNIETTLKALPSIIEKNPEVLFLIIGKTHPEVVKKEGEKYREDLEKIITELHLEKHTLFINEFLSLSDLLEYLQLTDIYLFTSKEPNQAVSGTFSYAISCGCPIISTPIPHAREVLKEDIGRIVDFENSDQLAHQAIDLLNNEELRKSISLNGLHKIAPTAWENSANLHAALFKKNSKQKMSLNYKIPEINLDHIKKMTTKFGIIQFSKINEPDIKSGYTLDDNARALIAFCQHFELTKDRSDLEYIQLYFNFIKHCLKPEGYFLNYVDEDKKFNDKNNHTNLADANGRAIWALGYMVSLKNLLPEDLHMSALHSMQLALSNVSKIHSTRAMAFIIKGLYYSGINNNLIKHLADKLVQMYKHEAKENWLWYESYLTYANSILPEAMLYAWLTVGDQTYKDIAQKSLDFLLNKTFKENRIRVISNKGWMNSDQITDTNLGGEQPIDVAYTILTLNAFYEAFNEEDYKSKMKIAFDWFLGNNHLNQIIYNPCTGGCYDGLEDCYINLNQGAESSISYLMARLTMEKIAEKQAIRILSLNPISLKTYTNSRLLG